MEKEGSGGVGRGESGQDDLQTEGMNGKYEKGKGGSEEEDEEEEER